MMPIVIDCDACGKRIDVGNDVYCVDCVSELRDKIDDLQADLDQANKDIKSYEKDIYNLTEQIRDLQREK
jgi:hypothetical protein